MAEHWLMDINKKLSAILIVLFLVLFPLHVEGAQADNQITFSILPSELKPDEEDYCSVQLEVPDFDRAELYWSSLGTPTFYIRTREKQDDYWSEWQPIEESGHPFLRNIGGIFNFSLFESKNNSPIFLELRTESNEIADLQEIQLCLQKEQNDTVSTIVTIIVMIAAGSVLYIKKKREFVPS